MDVCEQLNLLRELGKVDVQLIEIQRSMGQLNVKVKQAQQEEQEYAHKLNTLASKQAEVAQQQRQHESQLQIEKGNLRKWEVRAQDLRRDREYAALMSEIGSQKRLISELESQVLQCMQNKEELDGEAKQIQDNVGHVQNRLTQEHEEVKDEMQQMQKQYDELRNRHNALQKQLPKPLFARYERIASKRSGQGVALLQQEICQACMRKVPPELFLRVFKAEMVEQCPHCQRLLVAQVAGNRQEEQASQ
ncbi:MAG: C4-type zinc ribbon domain-containing protein [Myxococcota bacterium]